MSLHPLAALAKPSPMKNRTMRSELLPLSSQLDFFCPDLVLLIKTNECKYIGAQFKAENLK